MAFFHCEVPGLVIPAFPDLFGVEVFDDTCMFSKGKQQKETKTLLFSLFFFIITSNLEFLNFVTNHLFSIYVYIILTRLFFYSFGNFAGNGEYNKKK